MAIKSANDSVVSTGTEETASLYTVSDHEISSSDDIASKKTKKQKKGRSRKSTSESKKMRKSKKSSSKDKKKNNKAKSKKNEKKISLIQKLLAELNALEQDGTEEHIVPSRIFVEGRALSNKSMVSSIASETDEVSTNTPSTATVGTKEFYNDVASKLRPHRKSICIQGDCSKFVDEPLLELEGKSVKDDDDNDFQAAFGPNDMRCLALVSHNEMKSTMKDFVIHHKHILKKFRLTGTQSTMKMLAEVFADEPDIVFGPSCNSGPLGGDAELVALMAGGNLGGILFFQDPMTSHPHQADIECLVRQAQVHNTVIATTPTTAMTIMEVFRIALMGEGKPELLPSFFFSLQSPTVEAYKNSQKKVVRSRSCVI